MSITRLTKSTIEGLIERQRQAGRPRLFAAGGGLGLWVSQTGACSWRLRYRLPVDGKLTARTISLGVWPEVDLDQARVLAAEAKAQIRHGLDPVARRRLARAEAASMQAQDMTTLTRDWLAAMRARWSPAHYVRASAALERDVLPALGRLPVAEVTPAMVAAVIARIAQRGAVETAGRVRQHVALVFDYARVRGLRLDNPVVRDPTLARTTGSAKGRLPAIINLIALGRVLRETEAAPILPSIRLALWVLAHTVVRPGELVPARWTEISLDGSDPRWTIPRARMKRKGASADHAVPLAPAVVARLREWRGLVGDRPFVFASRGKRGHVTVDGLDKVYRETLRLRGLHVPHGWRSAFSSNANDALDLKGRRRFEADVIEVCLDHLHDSAVSLAYDRGERWEARRDLMCWWAGRLAESMQGRQSAVNVAADVG